jgi:deleted-in-malignant-brain-tumors protein 1
MVSYINTLDSKVSGTVFSAFAAKCSNSDTVQVELNSNSVLIVLVNGEAVSFEDINSLDFRKVTVSDRGNSTISTTFACGAYIEVKEENGIISVVFVSLSKEFRGLTRGLMGNFNGNTSDDLMPNGSDVPISLNSSLKTIHEQFGITWIIQDQASSILTYNDNANWTDFYDPSFIPSFEPVFFNSNLENEAREICDGDKDCLFDIAATGDKNIGRAVKNVNELVERMSELSHPPVCNPDCVHGRCVQNDTCECGSGYEGPICSEIVLPIPSVMCTPWLPFGVFISWTVSSPHTIEGYRLQVFTVSSGGNYNLVKVNELLPHATLSLFPARRGVRYAIQVEARVAGRYGPPGQIMTQL